MAREGTTLDPMRPQPQSEVNDRPWGRFELLTHNESTTVKIITVKAGERLSLQTHDHRDEWWVALDAGLTVDVGGRTWEPAVGEHIWIPRGTVHRAAGGGSSAARFLEIAFGEFDEEDITRLEDDYSRQPGR